MNRHQRRAEAARARSEERGRREAIFDGQAYLASCKDPTVTGATLILPSGEIVHLSSEAAVSKMAGGRPH